MRYSKPVLSCKTSSSLAPQVWKREALIERRKKPSRSELGPVGKKRRRELERGRRRKESRLWVWVWRKGGGGFGRDGEVKRIERVSGLGLKKLYHSDCGLNHIRCGIIFHVDRLKIES